MVWALKGVICFGMGTERGCLSKVVGELKGVCLYVAVGTLKGVICGCRDTGCDV